jgi:hypothetical protein
LQAKGKDIVKNKKKEKETPPVITHARCFFEAFRLNSRSSEPKDFLTR